MLTLKEPRLRHADATLVVPLESKRCTAPSEVGWKAARLAKLVEESLQNQAPFRVPAGVVVTTAALFDYCARVGSRRGQ